MRPSAARRTSRGGGNQAEAITTNTEFDPAEIAVEKPAEMRGLFNLSPQKIGDVIATNTLGTMIPFDGGFLACPGV